MIFILSKILLFLIKPLIWVFAIFIFAIFSKNSQLKRKLFIAGTLMLFAFSNNFLVGKIYNLYEAKYPIIKSYDIGILLGGFSKPTPNEKLAASERGDRLTQTVLLFKTGRIKKILISGGSGKLIGKEPIEADLTSEYLRSIGIPDSSVIIENKSKNTIENANYSVQLARKNQPNPSVLVITSAWHIPRSKLIFDKVFKQKLDYYPTDFIGKEKFDISEYYLPDPGALISWEYIIKEWVGYIVDSIRR